MDQRRTVIHESHGLDLGKSAPVTAGNEGDAQRMKTRAYARISKNLVDAPVLVGIKHRGDISPGQLLDLKRWSKSWVNRYCEILTGIVLASLCIAQPNSSACQVDIFHWDRTLGKPASGVESDFKANPHPFGLICELGPNFSNLGVRQLRLNLLRGASNPQTSDWVGLGELASDGFVNELGEEFDLKQGRVVADFLSVDLGRQSPANIRPAMRVSDLPRVNDALLVQEGFNGLPSDCVTLSGSDVARYPSSESWGSERPANPLFFDTSFIGQPLSFSGIGGVVDSQAGGFLDPQTGIQIASAEIPKRGAFFLSEMSHSRRVVQSRSSVKWNNGDCRNRIEKAKWAIAGYRFLPLHYEASLFPVENSRVVQESLISGYFRKAENTPEGTFSNNLSGIHGS